MRRVRILLLLPIVYCGAASLWAAAPKVAPVQPASNLNEGITAKVSQFSQTLFEIALSPEDLSRTNLIVQETGPETTYVLKNSSRRITFTIDTNQNIITALSALKGATLRQPSTPDTNVILTLAAQKIMELGISTNDVRLEYCHPLLNDFFEMVWRRSGHGHKYRDDFVRMIYETQSQAPVAFRRMWREPAGAPKLKRTRDEAFNKATARIEAEFSKAIADTARASSEPFFVRPNTKYGATAQDGAALAWIIQFRQKNKNRFDAEVWVDANTGEIVGGLSTDQ